MVVVVLSVQTGRGGTRLSSTGARRRTSHLHHPGVHCEATRVFPLCFDCPRRCETADVCRAVSSTASLDRHSTEEEEEEASQEEEGGGGGGGGGGVE